jgi:hypothetical protein
LGTVAVLLVKEFIKIKYTWVDFFTGMFYFAAAAGILFVLWGSVLFTKIYRNQNQEPLEAPGSIDERDGPRDEGPAKLRPEVNY